MAKTRWVSASVSPDAEGRISLEARRRVLMELVHAEVSESTRRVRAFWHDYANGWEVELQEVPDRRTARPWWKLW